MVSSSFEKKTRKRVRGAHKHPKYRRDLSSHLKYDEQTALRNIVYVLRSTSNDRKTYLVLGNHEQDGLLTRFEERRPFLARFLLPLACSSPWRSSHPFAKFCLKCATRASAMVVKAAELGTATGEARVRARGFNVGMRQHG